MDYEQKYNETLERARNAYQNIKPENTAVKAMLEEAFPELRESENERIRKSIVATIEQCPDDFLEPKNRDRMLDWLEKQKENPKSADSIPSFCISDVKLADTIITRAIVALSNDVDYNRDEPCKYRREIDDLKKLRDVLCGKKEQKPADDKAFEKWLDEWYQGSKEAGGDVVMSEAEFKNWSRGIRNMYQQKPALRFVGNGLISDPNSQFELEGEQKSAEWSEDEKIRKGLIEYLESDRDCQPCQDVSFYNEAISYLERQKDEAQKQFNLGVQAGREEVMYEMEKEQKPQIKDVYPIFRVGDTIKPKVYNESHRINKIKDDNYVLDNGFTFPIVDQDVWEIVEQPAEWSEEDIDKMVNARSRKSGTTKSEMEFYRQGIKDTLKSLQPHWKPSEEQIKCFEKCVNKARDIYNVHSMYTNKYDAYLTLKSLYEDLKSL